jgi:hypothetical protein
MPTQALVRSDLSLGAESAVKIAEVGPSDSVLIVSDHERITEALAMAVAKRGPTSLEAVALPDAVRQVTKFGPGAAAAVANATVIFNVLSAYDRNPGLREEEQAIRNMLDNVASSQRVYHMLGVTEETFVRGGALVLDDEEFAEMERLTKKVALALTLAQKAHVASGVRPETNLAIDLGGLENVAQLSTGRLKPGSWGNLPSGEAFILPVSATGTVWIDRAVSGLKEIEPFKAAISDGRFYLDGPAPQVRELFEKEEAKAGDRPYAVWRLAEFGVGTNRHASLPTFLEIEKIRGTVHIAIGSNKYFGGLLDAPNHTDMVIDRATLTLDDVTVIRDGVVDEDKLDVVTDAGRDLTRAPAFTKSWVVTAHRDADVRIEDGRLYRHWTDARKFELTAPVGSFARAADALAIWQSFPRRRNWVSKHVLPAKKSRFIRQIVNEAEHGKLGGLRTEDKVTETLRTMWLYGLVTFEEPDAGDVA